MPGAACWQVRPECRGLVALAPRPWAMPAEPAIAPTVRMAATAKCGLLPYRRADKPVAAITIANHISRHAVTARPDKLCDTLQQLFST